jgi:hypothetical protein
VHRKSQAVGDSYDLLIALWRFAQDFKEPHIEAKEALTVAWADVPPRKHGRQPNLHANWVSAGRRFSMVHAKT